ncbi:MAG: DUF4342 domain-containing protein [Balneolales bacterium]|nr:DUF4342 domain-containing protein [Balneolales bacterium]
MDNERNSPFIESLLSNTAAGIKKARILVEAGNRNKVLLRKKNGKTILETNLTIGTAGLAGLLLLHPLFSGAAAAYLYLEEAELDIYPEEQQKPPKLINLLNNTDSTDPAEIIPIE